MTVVQCRAWVLYRYDGANASFNGSVPGKRFTVYSCVMALSGLKESEPMASALDSRMAVLRAAGASQTALCGSGCSSGIGRHSSGCSSPRARLQIGEMNRVVGLESALHWVGRPCMDTWPEVV